MLGLIWEALRSRVRACAATARGSAGHWGAARTRLARPAAPTRAASRPVPADYMTKIAVQGRSSRDTKIGDVMTPNPITVSPQHRSEAHLLGVAGGVPREPGEMGGTNGWGCG